MCGDCLKKKGKAVLGGLGVGFLNGLLGAGGGIILVPLMETLGVKGKKSHATTLAVIVPLSLLSFAIYLSKGWVSPIAPLPYLLPGMIGGVIGGMIMGKVDLKWLKLLFGALLIWGGVQSFL